LARRDFSRGEWGGGFVVWKVGDLLTGTVHAMPVGWAEQARGDLPRGQVEHIHRSRSAPIVPA
jgi:hypothetical protein